MPSETIDFKCFSSSLYSSEDICSSNERQASVWKSDNLPKCFDFDEGIKTRLNVQALAHLSDSSKVKTVATQHESSLVSSSLSELFSRKLRLSANNGLYGRSVDSVASHHYEEERLFDSLEELEAQIIGNLLPSDDDFLSGVTDGFEHIIQDSSGDDMDELDLFSSVGGMDLGDDNNSSSSGHIKSVDNNRCEVTTESGSPNQLNFDIQAGPAFHPHSLPECHNNLPNNVHCSSPQVTANINLKTQERIDNTQFCQVNPNGHFMEINECVFKPSGNGSFTLPGHHYKWSNSYQAPGMMWPNSPSSYFDGVCAAPNLPRLHGLPRPPSHMNMMATVLPINGQHVPFWDRRHTYAGESPGSMQFSGNTAPHCVDFVTYNIFPHFGGNCVDLRILPKNLGVHFHNQRDLMFPRRNHNMINSFETHKQRTRSRRNEGLSNLDDKKQYELDIDRIKKGENDRTTLMIKNIPNKYTSKMLLAAIDERHRGTYDFVYLPIDFRNKCNVGYAFINMINPGLIIPFYQVFNGKKWEKFNSEKVASLAYARIQGKSALIAHFQNSSLMNEDKRCRPILFNTDGPNAGDQVPFPVGINIRNKAGRVRNNTQEDNLHSLDSD